MDVNKIGHYSDMGVRRLFSRGGQNFSGGAKTYYLPKMHLKRYYFPPKKLKNILIGPARGLGGARAPSCPPLRTPMHVVQCFQVYLFQ